MYSIMDMKKKNQLHLYMFIFEYFGYYSLEAFRCLLRQQRKCKKIKMHMTSKNAPVSGQSWNAFNGMTINISYTGCFKLKLCPKNNFQWWYRQFRGCR